MNDLYPPKVRIIHMGVGAPRSSEVSVTMRLVATYLGERTVQQQESYSTYMGSFGWSYGNGFQFNDLLPPIGISQSAVRRGQGLVKGLIFSVWPHLTIGHLHPLNQFTGDILAQIENVSVNENKKWTQVSLTLGLPIDGYRLQNLVKQISKVRPGAVVSYETKLNKDGKEVTHLSVKYPKILDEKPLPTLSSTDPAKIPQMVTAELEKNQVEIGDFEIFHWLDAKNEADSSQVYFVDFASAKIQGDYLDRIAYFAEFEPGVVLPRYQKEWVDKAPNGLRDGHNLTAEQIAKFFNRVPSLELRGQEEALRDYLLKIGFLRKDAQTGEYVGCSFDVLLTGYQTKNKEARKAILHHERVHGLIQSSPKNLQTLQKNYQQLSSDNKLLLGWFLSLLDYHAKDPSVVMNEGVTYYLTGDESIRSAFERESGFWKDYFEFILGDDFEAGDLFRRIAGSLNAGLKLRRVE